MAVRVRRGLNRESLKVEGQTGSAASPRPQSKRGERVSKESRTVIAWAPLSPSFGMLPRRCSATLVSKSWRGGANQAFLNLDRIHEGFRLQSRIARTRTVSSSTV